MPNNQEADKGLNILCMDGGGVRGLSSLIVLQEIMLRIEHTNGGKNVQPHEHFDLIAVTALYRISACMLGRLRMPVKQAIDGYVKLMKGAFTEKKMNGPTLYKSTKLQDALKTMIREATGDQEEMMIEGRSDGGCKTAVLAMAKYNLNAGLPVMFRSYPVTANPGPDCTIWQALHATMAHPDLFKSIDIMESSVRQSFVGGELGCSNPLGHVLTEVQRVYPDRRVACIISIGAGHARTIQVPNPSWWHAVLRTQDVLVMKDMATDSERVAEEMALRFQKSNSVYFRFNVDHGMQGIKDGSWERLGETMQHTKAYLRANSSGTSQRLENAVRTSIERRGAISAAQAAGQIPTILESAKLSTGFKRCPAPTKLYTGRKDENSKIISCITGSKDERRVCVVYGLGGVGKTQLVLKVIENTWDEWDHVIYIDASSREAIEKSFKEFAAARGIGQGHEEVINWLCSRRERWLVVFDNADTPSTNIRQYLPTRSQHGSVLITTRLPDLARLAEGPDSVCNLSSMSEADGLSLFVKSATPGDQCPSDEDMIAAGALVREFGCLALAIVHAGAYIAHTPGMSIPKYQALLLSQRRRMLEEYRDLPVTAKLDDYGETVYTTWRMCYDQLKPESRTLLGLIAYLHYDDISEDIFKRSAQYMLSKWYPLPPSDLESQALSHVTQFLSTYLDPEGRWDAVRFAKTLADLSSYSLIDFDRMNLTYRVHVLVHDWARTVISQEPKLAIECTATLLSLSINVGEDAGALAFERRLGLHVNNLLKYAPNLGANHGVQIRYVFKANGLWAQQLKLEQELLEIFQRELGDHLDMWLTMAHLAYSYIELNQPSEAEPLLIQVVDACKRHMGVEDPRTLRTMNNLATTYLGMGHLDQATQLLVQILGICKRVLGEEHFDTLRSVNNLAFAYRRRGRFDEAERLEAQALHARIRSLGEEHPETLMSMRNLAHTRFALGRQDEAAELLSKATSIAERVLGNQHPDTIRYREYLKDLETRRKALKVTDLKELLTKSGTPIPSKANKADLIAKILATPEALKLAGGDAAPAEPAPAAAITEAPSKPDDDLLAPPDEFDWDGTSAKPDAGASAEAKPAESTPATTTESAPATAESAPAPAATNDAKPAEGEASTPAEGETAPAEGDGAKPVDEELERRKARAARFGVPLVENPVSTKPASGRGRRGKKGGDDKEQPASKPEEKKEAAKKPEEKKEKKEDKPKAMKISAKEAAPNDDDAKLAARAARFGISTTTKPDAGGSTDPAEEDKRKKREARFGAPASKKAKTEA